MNSSVKILADFVESTGQAKELFEELASRGKIGQHSSWLEGIRGIIREELAKAGQLSSTNAVEGFLSVEQSALIAGVSRDTIRDWIAKGKLHVAGKAGNRYRIRKTDLENCLKPALQTPIDPEEEARKIISLERRRSR